MHEWLCHIFMEIFFFLLARKFIFSRLCKTFFQYRTWFLPSISVVSLFIALTYADHQESEWVIKSRRWWRWSEREKWKKGNEKLFLICLFIYAEKKSNWNFPLEKKESVSEKKALKFMELQWRVRKWKGFRYLPYSSSVPHSRSLNNEILSGENFASSFCFTYVRRYAFFCVC